MSPLERVLLSLLAAALIAIGNALTAVLAQDAAATAARKVAADTLTSIPRT
jgi:hypothetical protein